MATNSISFIMNYDNTDFTRTMTITDIADSIAAAPADIKTKVQAINASLSGGTSDSLDSFFRSDDYDDSDPTNIIGTFKKISDLKLIIVNEIPVNLD